MKQKGFTLVELLGVFSITALILLITVPTVTNMLRKAKDNQYNSFKEDIFLAAEAYIGVNHADFYELKQIGGKAYISLSDLMLSDYLKSTIVDPKTNKKVLNESNYTVIVTTNEKKTFDYELIENEVYHPYKIGDEIYFDPGDGIVRTFNVIDDSDETNPFVTIVLNQTIGTLSSWNATGSNLDNPVTALAALSDTTNKWVSDKVTGDIRLMTSDEATKVINSSNANWFFIDQRIDMKPTGFWTSTLQSKSGTTAYAYAVKYSTSKLENILVSSTGTYGIRPVITIEKYK